MSRPNAADGLASVFHLYGSHTAGAYARTTSGTSASLTLPAGTYYAWLLERPATTSVFFKIGGAATVPADATVDAAVFGGPGDRDFYFVVKPGDATKTLNVIVTAGTPTLYVVGL